MRILLVVDDPNNWPLNVPGVEVVAARRYLTDPAFNEPRGGRVFNLCRSYSYQSLGYYVSLLAEARGHKPQPDIITIQDMASTAISRVLTDDMDEYIQKALRPVHGDQFTLSIYFGRTVAERDRALGSRLYTLFRSPLLRAQFAKKERWFLQSIRPVPASGIPKSHLDIVVEAANAYFSRAHSSRRRVALSRFDLAILVDPLEELPPSDERAIQKFVRAAQRFDVDAEIINRDDIGRLVEFDALFIRATTSVNHYTFRFSRRAEAEGLAVIDDPQSISRCTNKVYLAERLALHHVPIPHTMIIHRDNVEEVLADLGLPCVLKQPDSSFSAGVTKAQDPEEYRNEVKLAMQDSALLVAQEYIPTEFDWRIIVLDGQPICACKYFMARGSWQILRRDSGRTIEGAVEALPVGMVPRRVVSTAVKAARLIGEGLYGVDLKQVGAHVYVIEINDNPSIEAGYEDSVYKDELYDRIIQAFVRRVESIRGGNGKFV